MKYFPIDIFYLSFVYLIIFWVSDYFFIYTQSLTALNLVKSRKNPDYSLFSPNVTPGNKNQKILFLFFDLLHICDKFKNFQRICACICEDISPNVKRKMLFSYRKLYKGVLGPPTVFRPVAGQKLAKSKNFF